MSETMTLTPIWADILAYMDGKGWVAPTRIGKQVGGHNSRGRIRHSSWASPKLQRMATYGLVIRNDKGYWMVTTKGHKLLEDGHE